MALTDPKDLFRPRETLTELWFKLIITIIGLTVFIVSLIAVYYYMYQGELVLTVGWGIILIAGRIENK